MAKIIVMTNLRDILAEDIFSVSPTQLPQKISTLLQLFSKNKEILMEVDIFCHSVRSKSIYADPLRLIDKNLKNRWLDAWLDKGIEKNEMMIAQKYFYQYTAIEQNNLKKEFKKIGVAIEAKNVSDLSLALADLKRDNYAPLRELVEKTPHFKDNDLKRIRLGLERKMNRDNFDIFMAIFKLPRIYQVEHHDLPSLSIIKQSPEDFRNFFDIYYQGMKKNLHYDWENYSFLNTILEQTTSLSLDTYDTLNISQIILFMDIADEKPEIIYQTICNLEYALIHNKNNFYKIIHQGHHEKMSVLDILFNNAIEITRDFSDYQHAWLIEKAEITQDEWKEKSRYVEKTYRHLHLDSTLAPKIEIIKKMKI